MKNTITTGLLALLTIGAVSPATAQQQDKKLQLANNFVTSYNNKDYKQMGKRYSLLMKIFANKKMRTEMFGHRYSKYGQLTMAPNDIKIVGNKATLNLSYANDPSQKETLYLNFNKKNKIIGMFIQSKMFTLIPPAYQVTDYEATVDSIMADNFPRGFNGAVLYADGSEVLFRKSYGYTDLATQAPLNDNSLFELASCSKQFTAAAILKLQEEGKLSVDDSLNKYFPQLPYPGITVRHLLWHTSGLPDYMSLLMKKKMKKPFYFNNDMIEALAAAKPKADFAPGERYRYSNTGYALLASVVEKASGMSFAAYLDKSFFKPLGMTRTRVYNSRRTGNEQIDNYAYGYVYNKKDDRFYLPDSVKDYKSYVTKLDGIVGDGTVNTTITDIAKWNTGLNNYTVLSKASLDSAYTPGRLNNGKKTEYGYGVMLTERDNAGRIIWHTGGWPGYQTIIARFVDKGHMLVILSSKEYTHDDLARATSKIASLYINK